MVAALKPKNTVKQHGFALVPGGFTHGGRVHRFEDVLETRVMRSVLQHKVVLVGSSYHYSISVMFVMRNGENLQVTEMPTWTSESDNSVIDDIERAFAEISKASWNNRVAKYQRQVDERGFFEYNGWRFYPKVRRLHNLANNKYYDLDSCALGKSYGFISVKDRNEGLGSKLFRQIAGKQEGIGTLIDTDVFFALLKHYFGLQWSDSGGAAEGRKTVSVP